MLNARKSITVNLRVDLDGYVRCMARRENKSMNQIINEALEVYRKV